MLQPDIQQQVKISLQQDLNYREQQPDSDFVSDICSCFKNNCLKCGLKENDNILHYLNNEKRRRH